MKGKGIKGAIAASALSAVLCAGMLAGTTFAWFTDTVSSSGNRIMAGNLDITATVAEQTADGAEVSYEVGGETYGFGAAAELTGQAIINEEGWQPGDRNAKLLTVSNAEANLAAVIKLDFVITDNGLTDALWFDFVRVEEGAVTGTLTERPMDTLETFAADLEFTLEAGDDISFILFYGMKEEAGNTYQGESFGVDAYILARQATEGSEYDEAVARVATAEDLAAAVAEGKTAVLTEDVTVDTIPVNEEGDTAIVLGGNTLTTNQTETVVAGAGKTITITDGNLNATASTDPLRSILQATAGGTIELNDVEFTTNATGLLAMGEDATLRIVNSTVKAFAFCVSTNASGEENYYPNIEIVDSVLMTTNTNKDGCTGTAVLFNVPGSLSIENSTVRGECGAVFVRGGDAVIRNSVLSRPYKVVGASESDIYMDRDWASGNQAPLATLLIGNRSASAYQYPANVTLENCTITASTDGAKTVYIYGNATKENGATLTYDAATVIAPANETVKPVIVGGGKVTVNGASYVTPPAGSTTITQTELHDMLNDASTSAKVLAADAEITEDMNVYTDSTFDLGGNTITSSQTMTLGRTNDSASAPVEFEMGNGTYVVSDGNSGRIRFEDSCSGTFRDMTFASDTGSLREAIQVYAESEDGVNTYVFENCTFENTYVSFEGASGGCYNYNVRFVNCTFKGTFGNGGAAVSIDDYLYGTFVFENCSFDVTANGNAVSAICFNTYPNYLNGNTVSVTLKDITITGTSTGSGYYTKTPVPVRISTYSEPELSTYFTLVEEGTNTYTVDGSPVNYDGTAIA